MYTDVHNMWCIFCSTQSHSVLLLGCQVPECSTQILGTVAEFSAQMSQLAAPPEQGGQHGSHWRFGYQTDQQINRSVFSNIFSSIFSRFFIDHDRSKQAAELCRALKDPLTLAALELLGHSPRSGSAQVMEALLLRLRLEEVQIKPCNVWMTIIVIMFSF